MVRDQILVVHLGGIGDVCLSESTFLSLSRHFGQKLTALGYPRFLGLFCDYFSSIHSVEGREWLYLFADDREGPEWRRIILIGKDRAGTFRKRLDRLSKEDLLFVDMYPDSGRVHVEDYQLRQLTALGVTPVKKPIQPKAEGPLIVYPEKGYSKQKWPYENFLEVFHSLLGQEFSVSLLEPFDTQTPRPGSFCFDQLSDLRLFLTESSFFVSNDCGIAHLAASCGLTTITLFHDADPAIWRPLGNNHSIRCAPTSPSVEELLAVIRTVNDKQKS
jgi:ADP-heptose:LPS heptosyltransferase